MKELLAALLRAFQSPRVHDDLLRANQFSEIPTFSPWRALVTWRTPK
jgi:hypothetical protein